MIPTLFVDAFAWVVAHCLSLLPGFSLPGWLTTLPDESAQLGGYIATFSVWLPLDAVVTVLALVLTATAVALGVRIVRMAISHVTGGGGSVS